MANSISLKRIQVDKANFTILIVMSIAAFVTIFSLVASFKLIGQLSYQSRVVEKKEEALEQLERNKASRDTLVSQYTAFAEGAANIIGGSKVGSQPNDGDNAKIVLDALPSKYDYPALATSLEKLVSDSEVQLRSISGTDDELLQQASTESALVEIPFDVAIEASIPNTQKFLLALDRSIRPIKINTLTLTSGKDTLTLTVNGVTNYQPEKTLKITTETVE